MKFCINCQHMLLEEKCYVGGKPTVVYHRCTRTLSPVTGKPIFCEAARMSVFACGPDGVLYSERGSNERST